MARVDGSCANCTEDNVCADHVGDVDAAMRYYDDIDHEADAENILADLHSEMIGGVVDAGRAVRAALQARRAQRHTARSGRYHRWRHR